MRALFNILIAAAVIYMALGALLYVFQNRMVFLANMPGRALTASPRDAGFDFEDVNFTASDGMALHGWFLPAQGIGARESGCTLLFAHGNAQNISTHIASVAWLPAEGVNVFLFDYRGYGRSAGRPDLPADRP